MIEAAVVAAWILSRPAWIDRDLTHEQRAPMVERYARAAVAEASSTWELAALLAHGWDDTKFAYLVLTNRCSEMPEGQRCDDGRARGPYSVHESACPDAYRYPATSMASVRAETRCAISLLYFHRHRCRDRALTPMMGAFAGMGGVRCTSDRAAARVMLMRRIGAELAKAEARS